MEWLVLIHRVPREPSSPRIAIWRRLRALGVGQLGDGVVALPADARTREHLEWVADRVEDAGGTALLLQGHALSRRDEESMARRMADARGAEYRDLTARADQVLAELSRNIDASGGPERDRDARQRQLLDKLRADLRVITRRDYFPPAEREIARRAVEAVASALSSTSGGAGGASAAVAPEEATS